MIKHLDLSSPWQIYRQELAQLFGGDDAVTVSPVGDYDTDGNKYVTLEVANHTTAAALEKLFKEPKTFGNVKLTVEVKDTAQEETLADILRDAFAHNRLVRGVEMQIDPTGTQWTYLVMEADILQFPADNLADYRRNMTVTAEQAARDVLTLEAGTAICTAALNEN